MRYKALIVATTFMASSIDAMHTQTQLLLPEPAATTQNDKKETDNLVASSKQAAPAPNFSFKRESAALTQRIEEQNRKRKKDACCLICCFPCLKCCTGATVSMLKNCFGVDVD